MPEHKNLERSSNHLKKALQVKVGNDKNGNPVLVNKRYRRVILWSRIKGIFKYYTGGRFDSTNIFRKNTGSCNSG